MFISSGLQATLQENAHKRWKHTHCYCYYCATSDVDQCPGQHLGKTGELTHRHHCALSALQQRSDFQPEGLRMHHTNHEEISSLSPWVERADLRYSPQAERHQDDKPFVSNRNQVCQQHPWKTDHCCCHGVKCKALNNNSKYQLTAVISAVSCCHVTWIVPPHIISYTTGLYNYIMLYLLCLVMQASG